MPVDTSSVPQTLRDISTALLEAADEVSQTAGERADRAAKTLLDASNTVLRSVADNVTEPLEHANSLCRNYAPMQVRIALNDQRGVDLALWLSKVGRQIARFQ